MVKKNLLIGGAVVLGLAVLFGGSKANNDETFLGGGATSIRDASGRGSLDIPFSSGSSSGSDFQIIPIASNLASDFNTQETQIVDIPSTPSSTPRESSGTSKAIFKDGKIVGVEDASLQQSRKPTFQETVLNRRVITDPTEVFRTPQKSTSLRQGGLQTNIPQQSIQSPNKPAWQFWS